MTTPRDRLMRLLRAGDTVSARSVSLWFEHWQASGRPWPQNDADILDEIRARQRAARMADEPEAPRAPRRRTRLSPEDRRLNERPRAVLTAVAEDVAAIRRALGFQADAPFRTLEDAAAWLDAHTTEDGTPAIEYYVALPDSRDEYWPAPVRRGVPPRSPVLLVQQWAKRLEAGLAVPMPALVAHVLVADYWPGERVPRRGPNAPILDGASRFGFTWSAVPLGAKLWAKRVAIHIALEDVNDRTLRDLRQEIHGVLGLARLWPAEVQVTAGPTAKASVVAGLVAARGGPPPARWSRTFWTSVRDDLNAGRALGRQIKDPIAVARMFYRARRRTADHKSTWTYSLGAPRRPSR